MYKSYTVEIVKIFTENFLSAAARMVMVFIVLVASGQAANAEVTLKDVQTIVRTIGFLENAPGSDSVMAIIYDPNDNASVRDAHQIEGFIKSQKGGLQPRLISISNTEQLQNVQFAFITSGLQRYYSNIRNAVQNNKVLSFTLDRSCVDQNCCAIYINSKNRVEIVINKAGADKVDARFKPVFLIMVTLV